MGKIDRALLKASWNSWLAGSLQHVGPYWLQWLWMLLFCAVIAVGFTIVGFIAYARDNVGAWRNLGGWAEWYGRNLVISLTIGVLIQLGYAGLGRLLGGPAAVRRWRPWQRTLFFSGVPLACVAVGWPLGMMLAGVPGPRWDISSWGANTIAASFLAALMLTVLFNHFFATKAREYEAEKRATEAQLRLLQGQIEPHFLFNTLAGVLSLIDHEPAKAKVMLHAFTDYLRASLGTLRTDEAALADELALVENYLRLMGARMDDRLRWRVDIDEAARRLPLLPLLLQPLVENAIVHGLEPQVDGGSVRVSARIEGGQLLLQVQDDGRGLNAVARPGPRRGNGVALANVRSRLLARYGQRASLELRDAAPGTLAEIRLPIER